MIPLLLCLALLFPALPGTFVPVLPGITEGTAKAVIDVFLRLAFVTLVTALILLEQWVVYGRHRDSR